MKRFHIAAGVVIVAFAALGAGAFKEASTRYVSFEEARRSHAVVQVKGSVAPESIRVERQGLALRFDLVDDKGDRLPVVYRGPEPGGFRQAPGVVAVGQVQGETFEARNLLVKCPSKYEGVATTHPAHAPLDGPEKP